MADYYPLIARAVAGLDPSAPGEARRALYERARAALIAQLRGVQPPLSESEITRERLSLEEAVRKVESEAAQRAREARGGGSRAGDALRRNRSGETPAGGGPAGSTVRPRTPAPPSPPPSRNDRPPLGQEGQPRLPRDLRGEAPPSPPSRPQPPPIDMPDPPLPPANRAGGPRRADDTQAPGMRGFRDIAADTEDLGRAAAQANRAARRTYANVPSPSPEFDRVEPSLEDRGADQDMPYSWDDTIEETQTPASPSPPVPRARIGMDRGRETKRVRGTAAFPFKSAIALGVVLILAGVGVLWVKSNGIPGLFKSQPAVEAPKDNSAPATRPKIPDRVGQPSASDQPVAPVAQRVMLYDEDPSDPKGKPFVGSVVWRTEAIKATATQKADIAVRADVEIPDRKFKMSMSFRRNTDPAMPASHVVEVSFFLPQDFVGGGVYNIPGILMKSNEQARGTPLAGISVKVTDNLFFIGLNSVDSERQRNTQFLKERSWFDIPLVFNNQRRAIVAIEKGAPGERAFNEAFAAWGE
jgi:hypothetical protein